MLAVRLTLTGHRPYWASAPQHLDRTALRLCLDRLAPPRKDRHVAFELPPITCAADAAKTSAALMAAVAVGDLTPRGAAEIGKLSPTEGKRKDNTSSRKTSS